MLYVPLIDESVDEYQGESFTRSVGRADETAFDAVEEGYYELVDADGNVHSTDTLVKSVDEKSLTATVPKTDTVDLEGNHRLLISFTNSGDATFDDVVAEYPIMYLIRAAR